MTEVLELPVSIREQIGTTESRRLRRTTNDIPAVLFGEGSPSTPLAVPKNVFKKALENEAFYSSILTLNCNGEKTKAVLKALQYDPYKSNEVTHIDFQRVSEHHMVTVHIPLHFTGAEEAPGVRLNNGIIAYQMVNIEVRCLPKDLPEFIAVDLSTLRVGDTVMLSNIQFPEGVHASSLLHGSDQPVVSVMVPRGSKVDEEAEAAAATAAATPAAPATGAASQSK